MSDVLRPTAEEALEAWAARVRGNREQAERMREGQPSNDFYAPVAAAFKVNPRRTDETALEILRGMVEPGDTWLDIGAGGGRYALPLALECKQVIAVDTSTAMLGVLRDSMAEFEVPNVRIIQGQWPLAEAPTADCSLIAHIGYDIEDLGPFLEAMEASTTRRCVALLLSRAPSAAAEPAWPLIHGEARIPLPGLAEFLMVLSARGKLFEVRLTERPAMHYHSREQALGFLRQQLFIQEGGEKDRELARVLPELLQETDAGFAIARGASPLGVVSWSPR